jgi:hypothetical protein
VDPGRPRSPGGRLVRGADFRAVSRVPTPTLPAAPLISGDGGCSAGVRDRAEKFAGANGLRVRVFVSHAPDTLARTRRVPGADHPEERLRGDP